MSTIIGHHHQTSVGSQNQDFVGDLEKSVPLNGANRVYDVSPPSSISRSVPHNFEHLTPLSTNFTTSPAESPSPTEEAPSSASAAGSDKQSTPTSPVVTHPPSPPQVTFPVSVVTYNGSAAVPSTSSSPGPSPKPASGTRRLSTFRHVPLRGPNPRTSFPSSPLRPSGTHARTMSTLSSSSRQLDLSKGRTTEASSRTSSTLSTPLLVPERASLPNIPSLDLPSQAPSSGSATVSPSPGPNPAIPTPRISSPPPPAPPPKPAPTRAPTQPQGPPPVNSPAVTSPLPARPSQHVPRSPAPYRPDFQPRGVYRQRTDDFIEARRRTRDSGRIERTRLERRLEKLINLHFPNPHHENHRNSLQVSNGRVDDKSSKQIRRSSSIFDFNFSDLKHKSAADLWKDVIQSQASSGSKVDTRGAFVSPFSVVVASYQYIL